jgi:protein gp37
MGETTAIKWTDHTFNPWWGCSRVSPGCAHCYAETFSKRTGHDVWGATAPRRVIGPHTWNDPIRWNRAAEAAGRPALVFAASMADVFEAVADDRPMVDSKGEVVEGRTVAGERRRLFELVEATPWLRWQILTKRPENVLELVPETWLEGFPSNVWLGTTVEDQQRADERVPVLLELPAVVRFLSCEPLLGPVELRPEWLELELQAFGANGATFFPRVDWIIAGGESGPGHRPLEVDHARRLRDLARAHDVAFFFKQHGGRTPDAGGNLLDGEELLELPGRFVWEIEELAR